MRHRSSMEVVLRTVGVYAVLVLVLRLLGKRMAGQLSLLEMGVMISIGAIVSVPMQFPERGVLLAIVLLLVILGLQRGLAHLGSRRRPWRAVDSDGQTPPRPPR